MAEKLPIVGHVEKEEKPSAPLTAEKELAQKVKEARFADRVSLLGFKREEMTGQDISRLRKINEKIEETDAPWVVRVMDKLQRENLLDSFKPEDVEKLQKIAQEKGYNFQKEGIVSSQVKEMTSLFKEEKEKEKKAEEWRKTFHSGGTRAKERIEKATVGEAPREEGRNGEAKEWVFQRLSPEEAPLIKAEEAPKVAAEQKRERTHEEIARHLMEHPFKNAFEIFKKGTVDRLDRACREYALFWEKTGARALKGLSWTGEKAVGYPAGKVSEAAWAVGEFLEALPGAKRLEHILAIQANIETLKKLGTISEAEANYILAEILKYARHATSGLSDEIRDHRLWEEEKKRKLDVMKTFGHAREGLSRWVTREKDKIRAKKEQGTERRAKKLAEKLKI